MEEGKGNKLRISPRKDFQAESKNKGIETGGYLVSLSNSKWSVWLEESDCKKKSKGFPGGSGKESACQRWHAGSIQIWEDLTGFRAAKPRLLNPECPESVLSNRSRCCSETLTHATREEPAQPGRLGTAKNEWTNSETHTHIQGWWLHGLVSELDPGCWTVPLTVITFMLYVFSLRNLLKETELCFS